MDKHINKIIQITIPELLYYEFGNILAFKTDLSENDVVEAIGFLFALDFKVFSLNQQEYIEAVHLSRLYKITVYDASYVVLAKSLNADFVTADEKLAQKMKNLPFVKTLKSYSESNC